MTRMNRTGSVAFGFSAVLCFVVPATTEMLSVPVTNIGTFVGAVCFLAGAVLLLFERTEKVPAVLQAGAARAAVTGRETSSGPSGPSRNGDAGSRRPG